MRRVLVQIRSGAYDNLTIGHPFKSGIGLDKNVQILYYIEVRVKESMSANLSDHVYKEIVKGIDDQVPPPPQELFNVQRTYAKQRKDRLGDVINDYMNDEDVSPRQFYEELLSELDEAREYHQRHADRYENIKSLVLGHRDVTL